MEKTYFDAKFEGLENLMRAHEKNTASYIGAVSRGVKELRDDLQEHKESQDAHGLGATSRLGGSVVGWIGIALSAGVLAVEVLKK